MGGGGSTVIGTFGYMAPEQFSGQATPASDLYALGACLIHYLSNRSPMSLPQKDLKLNFQPFIQASGGFMRWLDGLIQPEPKERYDNAQSALQLLYELCELEPGQAPEIVERATLPLALPELEKTLGTEATPEAQHLLAVGETLHDYVVKETLTFGSHFSSYFVSKDNQAYFLKGIHIDQLENWKGLELFEREIVSLKRLKHPQIPKILEHFQTDTGDIYLVTPRIQERNIEELMVSGWRPTEVKVLQIADQALNNL